MKALFFCATLAALASGVSLAQDKPMQFDEGIVGKVAVLQNGQVSFNGRAVTIQNLRLKLNELKTKNGVVWYFREAPEKEPPAISTEVVQSVIDAKLPISLSTKPDFSTVVLPDGTIKPRR